MVNVVVEGIQECDMDASKFYNVVAEGGRISRRENSPKCSAKNEASNPANYRAVSDTEAP